MTVKIREGVEEVENELLTFIGALKPNEDAPSIKGSGEYDDRCFSIVIKVKS